MEWLEQILSEKWFQYLLLCLAILGGIDGSINLLRRSAKAAVSARGPIQRLPIALGMPLAVDDIVEARLSLSNPTYFAAYNLRDLKRIILLGFVYGLLTLMEWEILESPFWLSNSLLNELRDVAEAFLVVGTVISSINIATRVNWVIEYPRRYQNRMTMIANGLKQLATLT